MKYASLNFSVLNAINFDIEKVTDFSQSGSVPFVLYNISRITSILNKKGCVIEKQEFEHVCFLEETDFNES
eukprot:TRINITY_DN2515_c0_g1_i1.p2 TRINITY_DN2515_c0_g1~~TRINITY_DN2515_c0_g1_i1.p2  ORF type:complete len:71 (+),score=28.81 TRINITY_DN2515_c0_g1_i1:271-483(+)